MLLSIQHRTELAYTARISETVMEVRMTPRTDTHQSMRGVRLVVGPTAPLLEFDDWLGNRVQQFSIVPFHERVVILAESAVDTHRTVPPYASLDEPVPVPIGDHRLRDFLAFGGYVADDPRLGELGQALGLDEAASVGDMVERVATRLRDRLEYRKGETTSATGLEGVLDAGGGVCQDLAHVSIALLRRAGVPARYVSGYLHRDGGGELETHAWCEAWSGSAGWLPVDPTHRGPAGDGHVVVAHGRDYGDVPPNRGVFRGDAEEAITATVTIAPIEALPAGLLAPRGVGIDVPSYGDGPLLHREQLDYQQEQQQQ
jgi:transglutaminase-like putative cysteine protease